jgi:hypothetical protein
LTPLLLLLLLLLVLLLLLQQRQLQKAAPCQALQCAETPRPSLSWALLQHQQQQHSVAATSAVAAPAAADCLLLHPQLTQGC